MSLFVQQGFISFMSANIVSKLMFKTKTFKCNFSGREEFVKQMDKRRLSLKRAIAVYADNKGQTGTDLTLPAGPALSEGRHCNYNNNSTSNGGHNENNLVRLDALDCSGDMFSVVWRGNQEI